MKSLTHLATRSRSTGRAALTLILCALLAQGLIACGGGDPTDEEQNQTNPPDCKANPKQCV
jgi:hypothetical protein